MNIPSPEQQIDPHPQEETQHENTDWRYDEQEKELMRIQRAQIGNIFSKE